MDFGEPERRVSRREWLSVGMMSLGAFVVVVNATVLSPLLRPIALEFGISESKAGQLGTVSAVIGGLAAILFAPFMDRVSLRAWVLWQSLFLMAITIGSALAPTFAVLFLVRAFAGASMILAKCLASCAELFHDERSRNRAIGIVVSATTAGVIAGLPLIALVEGFAGWRWAFATLLVPLAILMVGHRLLSDYVPHRAASPRAGLGQSYRKVLGDRMTRRLLLAQFVIGLAYIGWITYLGAYVEIDFDGGPGILSVIFLFAGAGELLANNLVPIALRRISAPLLFAISGAGFAFGLATGGLGTGSLWPVFATTALISICSAAQYIVVSILLLDALPESRGATMSLATAAMGLGGALGVALAGFTLEWLDSYGAAFRVLALMIPVGVVTTLTVSRRASEPVPAAV